MLQPPKCQWQPERHGEMKLIQETETFWTFVCGCGCIRAISKPSVKASAAYARTQEDAQRIRALQRYRSSRPDFSLPTLSRTSQEP